MKYSRLPALALAALCCLGAVRGAELSPGGGPAAPTPEASRTAEPSPSPSPEPPPSPSPEPSPSLSPEPSPEPSPSLSPEPMPSPSGPMLVPPRPTPTSAPDYEVVIWFDTDPPLSDQPYLFPLGGSLFDLLPLSYLAYFRTDTSDRLYFSFVDWDISPLDLEGDALTVCTPGLFTISGMPEQNDYFVFAEDLEPLRFQLAVVRTDYVDLTACYADPAGDVVCPLYCRPADPAGASVLRSADGGAWEELSAGTDYVWQEDAIRFVTAALEPGVTYRYQIRYDGDGRSNVLSVCLTGDGLLLETDGDTGVPPSGGAVSTPTPSPTPTDNWGGDRDGGDWEDQDVSRPPSPTPSDHAPTASPSPASPSPAPASPSPEASPETGAASPTVPPESTATPLPTSTPTPAAPEPPAAPSERPAPSAVPVPEPTAPNRTVLTGSQLENLAEHAPASTLLFEREGVAVELSAAFLTQLGLTGSQRLEVTVERPAEDAFRLTLRSAGREVEELPATTVRFPWDGPTGGLVCRNMASGAESTAVYEPESGTVVCTISAAGTYQIIAEEAAPAAAAPSEGNSGAPSSGPSAAPENPAPRSAARWGVPAAVLAAGAAAGTGVLLWRRRHG